MLGAVPLSRVARAGIRLTCPLASLTFTCRLTASLSLGLISDEAKDAEHQQIVQYSVYAQDSGMRAEW